LGKDDVKQRISRKKYGVAYASRMSGGGVSPSINLYYVFVKKIYFMMHKKNSKVGKT